MIAQGRAGCATWRARPRCRGREPRRRSSPRPQAEYPDAAGVGRRAVPGAAPRARYTTRPRPSRATGAASTCCARPSCGRPPRRCAPGCAVPVRGAGPDLEDGAAAPVPRHPAGLVDRLGAPRGARRPTRGRAPSSTSIIGAAQRALAGDRGTPAAAWSSTPRRTRATASPAGGAAVAPAVAGHRAAVTVARRRRLRPRQRPGARRPRRPRPARPPCVDLARRPRGDRPRRGRQPAAAAPRPAERVGRLGRRPALLPRHVTDLVDVDDGVAAGRRRDGRGPASCAASARSARRPRWSRSRRAPAGSTSTPRSTGTRSEKFLKAGLPARRARRRGRRRRPSSATCSGPPTPTPAGRPPSSRPARTASCTSASPATGVAVVNDSTYGHDVTRTVRAPTAARRPRCGSRCCGRRASPTRRPTRARHRLRYALVAGRRPRRRHPRGLPRSTCPSAQRARRRRGRAAGHRGPRRHRGLAPSSSPTTPAPTPTATWWSGSTRRTAAGPRPPRPRLPGRAGVTATDLLERPSDDGGLALHDGGVELALRPFQVLTLRLTRPRS